MPSSNRVSIPHRQSKNTASPFSHKSRAFWFQFLIGSLKTKISQMPVPGEFLFQFLIGSLKTTRNFSPSSSQSRSFQFLIGSLKTNRRDRESLYQWGVSIPHRQSKNQFICHKNKTFSFSFNIFSYF